MHHEGRRIGIGTRGDAFAAQNVIHDAGEKSIAEIFRVEADNSQSNAVVSLHLRWNEVSDAIEKLLLVLALFPTTVKAERFVGLFFHHAKFVHEIGSLK